MRAKDFNAGLRGVLFEAKHYEQMGPAVWLYGWLVLRQTRQVGTTGLVLGGRPVSYREIEEETGFGRKTLERWMRVLRRAGYIETRAVAAGIVVRITKAKKFAEDRAAFLRIPTPNSAGAPPHLYGDSRADLGGSLAKETPATRLAGRMNRGEIQDSVMDDASLRAANPQQMKSRKEQLLRQELSIGDGPEVQKP
jgi:hypothetical protein